MLFLLSLVFVFRLARKYAGDGELEAIFNYQAIRFLEKESTFWKVCLPGELPREALVLLSGAGGRRLLVLTTQRLLLFVANLSDRTLSREYPLGEISAIRMLEPNEMGWFQRMKCFLNPLGGTLRINFRDGSQLSGFVAIQQPVRRMSELLHAAQAGLPSISPSRAAQQEAENNAKATRQIIASLLVPGLGQWMQRRTGTALIFFVVWLLQLMVAIPIILAWWNVTTEVSMRTIAMVLCAYVCICSVAAFDVWRMRERHS
jgi:hypothetical protein